MTNIIIAILCTIGANAILIASLGMLRMPDFYMRLSVTVKASTLGVGLFLVSAALIFPEVSVTTKTMAIIFFLILTSPVAAHMIGKVAFTTGIQPCKETRVDDELKHHTASVQEEDIMPEDQQQSKAE